MNNSWRRKCRLIWQSDLVRNPLLLISHRNILGANSRNKLILRFLSLLLLILVFCNTCNYFLYDLETPQSNQPSHLQPARDLEYPVPHQVLNYNSNFTSLLSLNWESSSISEPMSTAVDAPLSQVINSEFLENEIRLRKDRPYAGAQSYIDYTNVRLGLKPLANVRPLRPDYGIVVNDVTAFKYPIDFGKCKEGQINANRTLFIAILSAPINTEKRVTLRKTWLSHTRDSHYTRGLLDVVGYGFVVGQTRDESVQSKIDEESKNHGDILQVEMDDSYYNLTRKSVAILNWVNRNCPRADFVLKVDDDVYVNVRNLANVLDELSPKERSVYGKHVDPGIISRAPCNKVIKLIRLIT